ncbi:hypothetical protein GFC01_11895 [Desulfofundulus thermobenzoicus]|uniref:Uncharacterized protein n=1 Tax=Desulfofundulus thermobenzoicus TaxID=29376 RepID=A0A6N7ITV5_9FIRM|nr:DUF6516 family protein [Desulfofundulus thermobenzoicus]MQL52949.1 hypothetical protein [Desulfofundulus thermobenzoicus]HHW45094.1 hypothetical protein [Desulfotomaculum sp.]
MILTYFRRVERRIANIKIISDKKIDFKEIDSDEGLIRGTIVFINGYILEFMEYIEHGKRLKYRFHLMDKERKMIFRFDNAPHYRNLTFPHHKHTPDGVVESKEMGIIEVLKEIETLILMV